MNKIIVIPMNLKPAIHIIITILLFMAMSPLLGIHTHYSHEEAGSLIHSHDADSLGGEHHHGNIPKLLLEYLAEGVTFGKTIDKSASKSKVRVFHHEQGTSYDSPVIQQEAFIVHDILFAPLIFYTTNRHRGPPSC
ncbi:MAG: hypothetical protein GY754_35525 [bacterium]|nr:hypothetical protein [bacterium]